MNLLDMCEHVEKRVYELMKQFRSRFQHTQYNMDDPMIYFDLNGSVAGQSVFRYGSGGGYLRFNRTLMKENWEDWDQVIVHEVAHFCVSILHGRILTRSGRRIIHGNDWKRMMNFFGCSPERCHTYDTSSCTRKKKKMKRYDYMCDCQFWELTQIRHNRILDGRKYSCPKCGDQLILV